MPPAVSSLSVNKPPSSGAAAHSRSCHLPFLLLHQVMLMVTDGLETKMTFPPTSSSLAVDQAQERHQRLQVQHPELLAERAGSGVWCWVV